ncbi:MAG: hypothetical protein N3E50_03245 [Candidatus Goldbacteria bacterium]|nr:hypothetical protein [Candidatus Goldiibacteriota bacterium]
MWLIFTFVAAVIATLIWYKFPDKKYKLGFLSSILWGATIMWLVDHVMAYMKEGGEFFEINTKATLLGLIVVAAAILIWGLNLLRDTSKQ